VTQENCGYIIEAEGGPLTIYKDSKIQAASLHDKKILKRMKKASIAGQIHGDHSDESIL
jgi:hypothetical protein